MRRIAREEASGYGLNPVLDGDANVDRVAELEQRVAELTARVDELEKAAAPAPAAKRTARKTTESTE